MSKEINKETKETKLLGHPWAVFLSLPPIPCPPPRPLPLAQLFLRGTALWGKQVAALASGNNVQLGFHKLPCQRRFS